MTNPFARLTVVAALGATLLLPALALAALKRDITRPAEPPTPTVLVTVTATDTPTYVSPTVSCNSGGTGQVSRC